MAILMTQPCPTTCLTCSIVDSPSTFSAIRTTVASLLKIVHRSRIYDCQSHAGMICIIWNFGKGSLEISSREAVTVSRAHHRAIAWPLWLRLRNGPSWPEARHQVRVKEGRHEVDQLTQCTWTRMTSNHESTSISIGGILRNGHRLDNRMSSRSVIVSACHRCGWLFINLSQ